MHTDYLGLAAEKKHLAKAAIKNKEFDKAWGYLHEQKEFNLKHASRSEWSRLDTLVLESSVHEVMANILRLEGKHQEALIHLSYHYLACYKAKRALITLEKKLNAYFNRVMDNTKYLKFKKDLHNLESLDFVAVRTFVTKGY